MKKKIAVIGSGIAGLTIANLFKGNSNFEVMVYEKEKILSLEEGYGIQLAPNSTYILNKIGLSNIDNKDFFNPFKLNFYSSDNQKICDLDLSRFNSEKFKYTTLKRSVLIEFLKNKLFSNNLKFGKEIKKVSKIRDKLLINFKDNTNDLVDFIVVSDGVFSNTKLINKVKINKKSYNIFCYLNKNKQIGLTKKNDLGFLKEYSLPIIKEKSKKNKFKNWNFLCNYKNSISNKKLDINLYYKFSNKIPKDLNWHSIYNNKEFIPTFTKKYLGK